MADILVRDLAPQTVERLKNRARQHGRSLQSEVKIILEEAGTFSMEEARQVAEQWRQRLAGRVHSDSAALIREDRDR
jgi:plasmid stability protein